MSILCARSRRFPKVFPSLSLSYPWHPPAAIRTGHWRVVDPVNDPRPCQTFSPFLCSQFQVFLAPRWAFVWKSFESMHVWSKDTRNLKNNYLSRSPPFRLSRIISRTFTIRLIYSPAMLSSKIKVSQSSEMWKEENLRISLSIPKKRRKEEKKRWLIIESERMEEERKSVNDPSPSHFL